MQAGLERLQEQQAATVQREQQVRELHTGLLQQHAGTALSAPPLMRQLAPPTPVDTPVAAFAGGQGHARTSPGAAALAARAASPVAAGWIAPDEAAHGADGEALQPASVRAPRCERLFRIRER